MNKLSEFKERIKLCDYKIIGITEVKPKNQRYAITPTELSLEEEEEEEEERLLWQINNNTMLYMISFAKETPIKTSNMSLAWEPPYYNDIIILI